MDESSLGNVLKMEWQLWCHNVFAHEFGHAIEHYTVFQAVTPTEGGADCFAGATFNSALADGQFPDYALDEAI